MELKHIDIAKLAISGVNMRGKGKADLSNILPSVRARGVLVPLIVRQNGTPDTYEIVAGKRRYQAALAVAQETGEAEALPCAVMEAGDDAAALEASLIENIARLDPDEVTRWECFTRLVREGRRRGCSAACRSRSALRCSILMATAAASSPTCSATTAFSPMSRPSGPCRTKRSKPASRPIARPDGATSSCCRMANRSIAGSTNAALAAGA